MSSATCIEKLMPFACLNFNDFSVVSHYLVSNGWNLMRLIFYIYHQSEVMHLKFNQGVFCYRGAVAL